MGSDRFPIARLVAGALALATGAPLLAQSVATDAGRQPAATRPSGVTDPRAAAFAARRVRVELRDVPLVQALDAIASRAGLKLMYAQDLVVGAPRISVRAVDVPAAEAFRMALRGTGLAIVVTSGGQASLVSAADGAARQSTGTIKGVVVDSATRAGVPRVVVALQDAKRKTVTDNAGRFTLADVPAGPHLVTVRLIGYAPAQATVTVPDGDVVVTTIALHAAATQLSQVVTTAAGARRRLEVGNDVTTLDVDSIRRVAPVTTVTDVLEGRVPGLVVQRSSGAPGAPSRVRVRGISSITGNNDPIVIVDNVRVYSNQTTSERDARFSVLDNIDVNSIETIDVLKGPSASALYGSDAANGVIVIKTKRGRPGKTHWTFSADRAWHTQPRDFADAYYLEGTPYNWGGVPGRCSLREDPGLCVNTRLFVLNPLADAQTTVLGTGSERKVTAQVSGGSPAVQYAITGSSSSDLGVLRMADADLAYLRRTTGASVPGWQRRPQRSGQRSGTAQLSVQPSPSLTATVTTQLTRGTRSTTPLDQAIGAYQRWTPRDSVLVAGLIDNFRQRTTNQQTTLLASTGASWQRFTWWSVLGDAGIQTDARRSETLLRRGDCVAIPDPSLDGSPCHTASSPLGSLTSDRDDITVGTFNLRTTIDMPRRAGVALRPSVGLNYVTTETQGTTIEAIDLPQGGTSITGARVLRGSAVGGTQRQVGMFVTTDVSLFDRLHTSLGTRVDASNALGKQVHPTYPKLDLSYLLSDEPFFPWKRVVNTLRLRLVYGHAAKQPEVGAALRTYVAGQGMAGGVVGPTEMLQTLGNASLRPERSREIEGGGDVSLWGERVTLSVTGAHKLTRDAILTLPQPLSLGGGSSATNYGSVRNTSTELDLGVRLLDRPALAWSAGATLTRERNTLVHLAPGFDCVACRNNEGGELYQRRYVEGYPIDGVWMRPVVGYADLDGDGVIIEEELSRGDTLVFVGGTLPNYDAAVHTELGLWHGRVGIATQVQYQDGVVQPNLATTVTRGLGSTVRAMNDRSTPLAEQLAVRSGYAAVRPVSTLRLQSLSVRVAAPTALARRLGATAASLALQGSNLGLWTNYSGADPNVTGTIVGNRVYDTGVLPQPRTWGLNVSLNY